MPPLFYAANRCLIFKGTSVRTPVMAKLTRYAGFQDLKAASVRKDPSTPVDQNAHAAFQAWIASMQSTVTKTGKKLDERTGRKHS